ncbi:MAG: hypothetical protein DBY04_08475 [Clostridiales bacterium]|nr:MAG: hypothetical protein DBY04_08475 [Clostridiales bacterium]
MAVFIMLTVTISLLPRFEIHAAQTFSSGAVVIDREAVEAYGTEYIIENGVYSVTVTDGVDVTLIFNGVTIDRTSDGFGDSMTGSVTAAELYDAGRRLHDLTSDAAWSSTPAAGGYYVPTCPFLITGGATVTARFDGDCTFRAGGNGLYLSSASSALGKAIADGSRGGYAGIQVDSGASLTIVGASDLSAYGAFPLAGMRDHNGNLYDSDPLSVNPVYNAGNPWARPQAINTSETNGGGAGIGGGASYNTTTIRVPNNGYVAGTPGEIYIRSGTITAVGGHLAAGIGGGVNSAATSSQIVIDGGNITAIGGRFATGIGDGDSITGVESIRYAESYSIIINGGTVDAYGGTSSAAIGTTDNITAGGDNNNPFGQVSGLSITISGGTVYGHSGEATGEGSATAAIGSGQNTDMNDNSITIYSASKVIATSFSQFAISNYGTNATSTPMVNIDPSGYMYLARFESMVGERIFTMLPVKRDEAGNPMLVSASAAEIQEGNIPSDATCFALDRERGQYYLVNADGVAIGADGAPVSDDARYYPPTLPALSYYYDTSSPIGTLTVPGNYTAFAATLADPSVYGGVYVVHVPSGGTGTSDDIYTVIQKHEAGTSSGQIIDQGGYHLTAGDNSADRETPSLIEDPTANPMTDLGIFAVDPETGAVETENRITQFNSGTYGYTVYLPYGTETFHLYSAYSVTDTRSTVTMDTGYSSSIVTLSYIQQRHEMVNTEIISMNGNDTVNVWLRKTEPGPDGQDLYVVYRVTVVIKDRYQLNLNDMNKVYDGAAVSASVGQMVVPGNGITYTASDLADSESNPVLTLAGDGTTLTTERVSLRTGLFRYQHFEASAAVQMDPGAYTCRISVRIDHYTDETGGSITESENVVILVDFRSGEISFPEGNATAIGNATISMSNSTLSLTSRWSSVSLLSYSLENVGEALSSFPSDMTMTDEQITAAREAAVAAAEAELAEVIGTSGTTTASLVAEYDKGERTRKRTMTVTAASRQSFEFSETMTMTGRVSVTVQNDVDQDVTSLMTALDRNAVVYTYYQDVNGNKILDAGDRPLAAAPKDAGDYLVTASLISQTYEAYGETAFTIEQRELVLVAVENWMTYLTPEELLAYDGMISEPGALTFTGIVSGESVEIDIGALFVSYVDMGTPGTYSDDIGYHEEKILVRSLRFTDAAVNANYRFPDENLEADGSAAFRVYGQIAYETTGAIFRKTLSADSIWRKFYPTTDPTFLKWQTDENGDYIRDDAGNLIPEENETRIDYHSPSNTEHRDYIYLRTVNEGERAVRYAVDIEFGAMQFTYSRAVWDVNRYDYVESETSIWLGNDGINNRISVLNYSNGSIQYSVDAAIDFAYRPITEGSQNGISLSLVDETGAPYTLNTPMTVPAATAATETEPGGAAQSSMQLVLSGVPQMTSEDFVTVGLVSVMISRGG